MTTLAQNFGMVVQANTPPEVISHQANILGGIRHWYDYDAHIVTTLSRQDYLIKMGQTNSWQTQAWETILKANPIQIKTGSKYILGNEPNNTGQDNQKPEDYARQLREVCQLIRTADPQATILAGGMLNWSAPCLGTGPGFTLGEDWMVRMVAAYRSLYPNEKLPFDRVMLHTSVIDWLHLPMINAQQDIRQIQGLRQWMNLDPELHTKPLEVEMAVLWAYDNYTASAGVLTPTGLYRSDLLYTYMNNLMGFLVSSARSLNISGWYPYITNGLPEPYATSYTGMNLLTTNDVAGVPTNIGRMYNHFKQVY